MIPWNEICIEGERLAKLLIKQEVDLSEAQKAGDYYRFKGWDEAAMKKYLSEMDKNPPVRSNRSQRHYSNIHKIWTGWQTNLQGVNKARAWVIAIRTAKAKKAGADW